MTTFGSLAQELRSALRVVAPLELKRYARTLQRNALTRSADGSLAVFIYELRKARGALHCALHCVLHCTCALGKPLFFSAPALQRAAICAE